MSRKDYERTAAIIAAQNMKNRDRHTMAKQFAAMFQEDNPRFDEHRFMEAAGVRYCILRMYADDRPTRTMRRSVTLGEAQAHCRRDDTRGDGWFDGYDVAA